MGKLLFEIGERLFQKGESYFEIRHLLFFVNIRAWLKTFKIEEQLFKIVFFIGKLESCISKIEIKQL